MIGDERRVEELCEFSSRLQFSCCNLAVILIKRIVRSNLDFWVLIGAGSEGCFPVAIFKICGRADD